MEKSLRVRIYRYVENGKELTLYSTGNYSGLLRSLSFGVLTSK